MSNQLNKLVAPEAYRQYFYADGSTIKFVDVVAVGVTKSGFHKLETLANEKFIVAPDWRYMKLDMKEWTF